ncbi:MAG: hypothetical protein ACK44N_00430 [Bacteroidota bacterium]|jgi:hypothetical protein
MKKITFLSTLGFLLLTLVVNAQTPPNAFNYSAVARNAAGQPIASTTIGIQITILKTSPTGISQYTENHFVNTDAFGLFNLAVGAGAVQSGSMSTIDWSNDNYYLKVGMDASGGTNFLIMGTTQLLSVPYALYSKTSMKGSVIQSKQYPDGFEGMTVILPATGTYTVPTGKYLIATGTKPDYLGFNGNFGMAVAGQIIGSDISYIDENIVITILGGGFTTIAAQLIDKDMVMPVFFGLNTTYTVPVNKTLVASLPWSSDATGIDYYLINGQTFYNPQIDVFSAGTTITYVANGTSIPLNNFLVSGYLK